MKKLSIALSILSIYATSSFAAAPELKIVSGVRDTIAPASTVIVGVTTPGAKATVNGKEVHVYKTGSFGEKIQLAPGSNNIKIEVTQNGEIASKDIKIYRPSPDGREARLSPNAQKKQEPPLMLFTTPKVVETKPYAYLQYGDGDDRLGGSKMGFIDPGIRLAAVGERGSLYKVRLGVDRVAYIPKYYANLVDAPVPETVCTGSWTITNAGKSDKIVVGLPQRLAWHTTTSLDPNEIYIDIFGAFDNSNWIKQRSLDLGIIDYVNFQQMSEDVYRVIIRLKGDSNWGFSVGYDKESTNLNISVRHRPKSLNLKDLVIGLDAGHGGENSGAVSPSGIQEKDINLDIVERLKALLEKKGAKVVLTRSDDSGPSMTERKRIWAEAEVDISISVHNNAGGSALDSPGTSVYYKHLFCRPFAETMLRSMLQTGLPLYGLVGNFNFSLVGPTNCPTCLVEGAFMSSLQEEEKLADPQFRHLMAQRIFDGLTAYLSSCK